MAVQKRMTEKEFTKVKKMQAAGLTLAQAASLLDRAPNTINRAYRSKAFEDLHKPKSRKDRKSTDDVVKLMKNVNDTLISLDKRMAWLEAHVPVADRKFFFRKG